MRREPDPNPHKRLTFSQTRCNSESHSEATASHTGLKHKLPVKLVQSEFTDGERERERETRGADGQTEKDGEKSNGLFTSTFALAKLGVEGRCSSAPLTSLQEKPLHLDHKSEWSGDSSCYPAPPTPPPPPPSPTPPPWTEPCIPPRRCSVQTKWPVPTA